MKSKSGEVEGDKEKRETMAELNEFTGGEAAGTMMVVEMGDRPMNEGANLVEKIDMPNIDSMFEKQNKNIKDSISEHYALPNPLMGRNKDSGIFSLEEYEQSFDIYNSETEDNRRIQEEVYFKIFKNFKGMNIEREITEIQPAQFGDRAIKLKDIPPDVLKDLTEEERRNLAGFDKLEDIEAKTEQLLSEKLGVGGTQSLIGVLTNPDLSAEQKINTITTLFGLTSEEAILLVKPLIDGQGETTNN